VAIDERFPDERTRHREAGGDYHYRPPNGETFGDIAVRLTSFLSDLHHAYAGRRVVVVAHDSVVLMMRAVIEGLDMAAVEAVAADGHVKNASITRFDGTSGELVLDRYNGVDHL
jgi:probable phosphoglycerate mutase